MDKKLKLKIEFEEIDHGLSDQEILLEILGLHGYFDSAGRWHDAEE